ncbi:UNVERIFIED_CONTAM: hypothetical protein FKN15_054784 [Acipenser sinensis]
MMKSPSPRTRSISSSRLLVCWSSLSGTAKALGSMDFGSLICNVGAGGATPDGAAPAGGALAASAPAQKAEETKKESEQSDGDMVFGLFD